MSRQRKMMSQHSSLLLEGFIVATNISMSRQRITIKADPVSRHSFSMSQQKVLDVGAFYVETQGSMSQQGMATSRALLSRQSWHDKALGAQRQKGFRSRQSWPR